MITLNDYLYSGEDDLSDFAELHGPCFRKKPRRIRNEIDMIHGSFLRQIRELLAHNDFRTAQSQQIREFYKYMARAYPFLAFTFRGRIKSLIRAEGKIQQLYRRRHSQIIYEKNGSDPLDSRAETAPGLLSGSASPIGLRFPCRNVIMRMEAEPGSSGDPLSLCYIANILPGFLEEKGLYRGAGQRRAGEHLSPDGRDHPSRSPGIYTPNLRSL